MKWLLAVLVGIVVGVAVSKRQERAGYLVVHEPMWRDLTWRDLERVDSV